VLKHKTRTIGKQSVTATAAGKREDTIHAQESSAIIALCIADSREFGGLGRRRLGPLNQINSVDD
jgi:hypothetical protein